MRVEEVLQFWYEEGGLEVGSRYLVPGSDGLIDVLEVRDPGSSGEDYLDVRVRDTATGREATKIVAKTREISA